MLKMEQANIIRRLEAIETTRPGPDEYEQDQGDASKDEYDYRQDQGDTGEDDHDYRQVSHNQDQGDYSEDGYMYDPRDYSRGYNTGYNPPSNYYSGPPPGFRYSTPRRPPPHERIFTPQHGSFYPPSTERSADVPKCNIIRPKNTVTLPSTKIDKDRLMTPPQAFTKYHKLILVNKIPTLATKLARDAYFGAEVLRRCTVMGCREQPGLPIQELNELKQAIFSKFPQFWSNAVEFEEIWVHCTDAIGQLCKRLRRGSL